MAVPANEKATGYPHEQQHQEYGEHDDGQPLDTHYSILIGASRSPRESLASRPVRKATKRINVARA